LEEVRDTGNLVSKNAVLKTTSNRDQVVVELGIALKADSRMGNSAGELRVVFVLRWDRALCKSLKEHGKGRALGKNMVCILT